MLVDKGVAVPMRDGVRLCADIYRPESDEPVPAVLHRTPYNRRLRLSTAAAVDPERAVDEGFALVCQDVRGLGDSGDDFYPFRNEGPDGYDTIEWIAAQGWSNGEVSMSGRSYPAATQWLAAAEHPPHLAAIAPVVIGSNYYSGWVYQGGAFQLGFNLFWVHLMAGGKASASLEDEFRHLPLAEAPLVGRSNAGRFYLDWLSHPTEDEYWQELAIDRRYESVEVPVLNVGGWYDVFLAGTLENFVRMRRGGKARVRLIVGPWAHGSAYGPYPDHSFDRFSPDDRIDLDAEQLGFFRGAEGPAVRIFVMGANRWRDEDDWPIARAREEEWFLRADGGLSREAPANEDPDEYVYDPRDPAPTIGGPTSLPGKFLGPSGGPKDQRRAEERSDVLVYTSEPLDRELEVTGPLRLVLHAATDATDTDWVAKLCDVDPDGFSRILAEGVLRARFRDGFDEPRLLEPREAYEYEIDLAATSNAFLPGHRIRVDVTSSSFPRFDRNANSGNPLGEDTEADLRPARQAVFHDAERPSRVLLPVVDSR